MATEYSPRERFRPEPPAAQDDYLSGWFSVSGDMDDFIYYGEPEKYESER